MRGPNAWEQSLTLNICIHCMPTLVSALLQSYTVVWNALKLEGKKLRLKNILLLPSKYNGVVSAEGNAFRKCQQIILPLITINAIIFRGQNLS